MTVQAEEPEVADGGPKPVGRSPLRVLFFVEGFTDIRFVVGLSETFRLTLVVAERPFRTSGLKERVNRSGAQLEVVEVPGNRLSFQARSLWELWQRAPGCDVILAQEVLRGALNANIVGALRRTPVVTYMGIAPLEYFQCRRERRQVGPGTALLGRWVIRGLMAVNGRMAARCLAMGPYLRDVAAATAPRSEVGLYYGVDTEFFRPADAQERRQLRLKHGLPLDRFLIFLSSRMSHEKDPETVLRAAARARARGLDAVVLNLGGGYEEFLQLARELGLEGVDSWVIGRPAAHPMTEVADYFRAADVMALASLAEGAAYSTLEALACGTPVVATAVGGMAVQLNSHAILTPRRDPEAMAHAFIWVSQHQVQAREQALRGREYVRREWNRAKAFGDLRRTLEQVASECHVK